MVAAAAVPSGRSGRPICADWPRGSRPRLGSPGPGRGLPRHIAIQRASANSASALTTTSNPTCFAEVRRAGFVSCTQEAGGRAVLLAVAAEGVVRLSGAQLATLLEGLPWHRLRPRRSLARARPGERKCWPSRLAASRMAPCRWRWMIFRETLSGCCCSCGRWLKSSPPSAREALLSRSSAILSWPSGMAVPSARGPSRDREAAALDPAAAAQPVRPALGEARPRPAPARPGGPRADRGRRRGGAGGGRREERRPSAAPGSATQPGRPAGAPAAGRDPGRRRGQAARAAAGRCTSSARTRARCSTSSPPCCG